MSDDSAEVNSPQRSLVDDVEEAENDDESFNMPAFEEVENNARKPSHKVMVSSFHLFHHTNRKTSISTYIVLNQIQKTIWNC